MEGLDDVRALFPWSIPCCAQPSSRQVLGRLVRSSEPPGRQTEWIHGRLLDVTAPLTKTLASEGKPCFLSQRALPGWPTCYRSKNEPPPPVAKRQSDPDLDDGTGPPAVE